MTPQRINIATEYHPGSGAEGRFLLGDSIQRLKDLLEEYEGRVKLIYMDPPFTTGEKFYMRVRVGEAGWNSQRKGLKLESFVDQKDRGQFLDMMGQALALCKRLLSDDGMIFVHVDYRAQAHLRLMMDELFGEDNFLNEIIWVYQTGGRSVTHFSRKHDNILFYRKSPAQDFNIEAVKVPPSEPRSNHMRRHTDPDGRVYRSIKVGERVYTYYDDDPVAPSDVWADVSHLQQRDPERTGYDTQKPLALLKRIVLCGSREGEWVLDPFCGSGTTLEAARLLGRNFLGIDRQQLSTNILRRRLEGSAYTLELPEPPMELEPACRVDVRVGVGFYHVSLEDFSVPVAKMPADAAPMDCVDNWSLGYVRGGRYEVMAETLRRRKQGALARELMAPVFAGQLAMCVNDVLGRSWVYALNKTVDD